MKRSVVLAILLGILATPATAGLVRADEPQATTRHVHGIITSLDSGRLTIASMQGTVAGTLDPARTKVTLGGKPGKLSDLRLTAHAKAELCLDDVWLVVDAH